MSHHRAPRVKRSRPSLPAGLGRLATAGLACVVVTGAAVVVGVAVTPPTETPTDVVALDTVTQPVVVPPPAEVPVEVRPVAGFEAPVTLGEGPGDGSVPRQVEPLEEQSVEDIPDEAAAAYQRAASVMAEARPQLPPRVAGAGGGGPGRVRPRPGRRRHAQLRAARSNPPGTAPR